MTRGRRLDAVAALYPGFVALLLVLLMIARPRNGPLALLTILSVHLVLFALALVPLAWDRDARRLPLALVALFIVAAPRFGGEWVSLPGPATMAQAAPIEREDEITVLSWNLQRGARSGEAAVAGILAAPADIVAIQELGPDHVRAIERSAEVVARFPYRVLDPDDRHEGNALLSAFPIDEHEVFQDPAGIEARLRVGERQLTVIAAHPLPARIVTVSGALAVGFDPTTRDIALERLRSRFDAVIGRGEILLVAGDFNTAPTEPSFEDLTVGLFDAHAEVGNGPGWTWRPRPFDRFAFGLLRIDLELAGPGLHPTDIEVDCSRPGDHCQVLGRFRFDTAERP